MEEMRGACFAASALPFRGRERTAVDNDVCPERRSLRYHESCLALGSVEESSAAVSKPRSVQGPSALPPSCQGPYPGCLFTVLTTVVM